MDTANHTEIDHCNESVSYGIFPQRDGTFLAMTRTQSKTFKTRNGAVRWFTSKASPTMVKRVGL